MKKYSAVEWLENEIRNSRYFYKLMNDIQNRSTIEQSNIFEQAKEIEKQQIMDAYEQGDIQLVNAEQYYNETFKK